MITIRKVLTCIRIVSINRSDCSPLSKLFISVVIGNLLSFRNSMETDVRI